jgi:CubicO group peptidase (beta-lactamase class C family)
MKHILLVLTLLLIISTSCSDDQSLILIDKERGIYQPEQLDDGWETSSLVDENVDLTIIEGVLQTVDNGDYDFLRSIVIAKNGKLIFEKYFIGDSTTTLFHTQSVTKSIASILIGIAFHQGIINSINDPIFMFFPEYEHLKNESNEEISLKHILTMTPGFEWNEVSTFVVSQENDNVIGHYTNYIEHVLSKPVIHTPGTHWYYNSGCAILAGGVIKNLTNVQPVEYARRFLFEPLIITDWFWPGLPQTDGLTGTHGALFLSARDMAKIGQLYLNGGNWNGQQIVAESWINESVNPFINVWGNVDYGYLWWTRTLSQRNIYYADGYGGQQIVVVPNENMVIITTATYDHLFEMPTNAHNNQREKVWGIIRRIIDAN